jgi:hypothetical protein
MPAELEPVGERVGWGVAHVSFRRIDEVIEYRRRTNDGRLFHLSFDPPRLIATPAHPTTIAQLLHR